MIEPTVTISLQRFLDLETIEKAYKESANTYYSGYNEQLTVVNTDDTIEKMAGLLRVSESERRHYQDELSKVKSEKKIINKVFSSWY